MIRLKLKYKRTIVTGRYNGKYRLYTAKWRKYYIMLAGNVGESLDWGLYINTEPSAIPKDCVKYMSGYSFKEVKEMAAEWVWKREIEEEYEKQGYGLAKDISHLFDHEFWEGELFPERFAETV